MAKVIKRGGQAPTSSTKQTPKSAPKRSGKVIDREVYNAQQTAQQILLKGENEKQYREEKGVAAAKEAYEANFTQAKKEAEQNLAFSLVAVFQQRVMLIDTAMEDVHTLSMEVMYKILGAATHLPQTDQDKIVSQVKNELLAQRTLTLGFAPSMLTRIEQEAGALFKLLSTSPDFQLQSETALQASQAWVATENLQFNASAPALLEHLASTYSIPTPSMEPQKPIAASEVSTLGTHEERTMAISLEELKERAMLSKRLKNKD